MTVSIIIRTKDEEASIGRTLESIFSCSGGTFPEVIVVDSGSSDKTLEIAKQYHTRILVIPPAKFSYGYSLNYGIEHAAGEIICCISAHCTPSGREWLSELVGPIIEGKSHATFGRQLPVKGVNPFEEISLQKHFPDRERKSGRVPFSNANCAFLKSMWHEMKFDEELPSWEDYLWYLLLKDKYTFQYCPRAAVYHTHPFSIGAVSRRAYRDGRAFRQIKEEYRIDLLNEAIPTTSSKFRILFDDIKNYFRFFLKEGYTKYLILLPVVRFSVYRAYWKGYTSRR